MNKNVIKKEKDNSNNNSSDDDDDEDDDDDNPLQLHHTRSPWMKNSSVMFLDQRS